MAVNSGLAKESPAKTTAMPHFVKVGQRGDHKGDLGEAGAATLGEFRHGQRDGVDIGQTGERRHRVKTVWRKILLRDLHGEQNHGEQRLEFRRGGQTERVCYLEIPLRARTNMTAQASRVPQARALAICG